jgi:LemA protein
MTAWVLLAIIAAVAGWAVMTFNGLVRRKTMTAEAWSGIETQLKRRADLIPSLVETVKGYAGHERETFEHLATLRTQGYDQQHPGERAQTEQAITSAIGKVLAIAEAYPQLRASENFQALQKDLAEVEDQLQLARRYYNGAAREYNVMIAQFPSSIVASWGGFSPAQFFEIDNAADRAAPKVSFT